MASEDLDDAFASMDLTIGKQLRPNNDPGKPLPAAVTTVPRSAPIVAPEPAPAAASAAATVTPTKPAPARTKPTRAKKAASDKSGGEGTPAPIGSHNGNLYRMSASLNVEARRLLDLYMAEHKVSKGHAAMDALRATHRDIRRENETGDDLANGFAPPRSSKRSPRNDAEPRKAGAFYVSEQESVAMAQLVEATGLSASRIIELAILKAFSDGE